MARNGDVASGTPGEASLLEAGAAVTWPVMATKRGTGAAGRRPGPIADPDQRRELLAAASRLLAAEGPEALTVRRIAADAGYSTMGVYSRFGGKDGIVEALFVEGFRGLAAAMAAVPDTDDPLTDLLACGVAYRRFALAHPTSYTVMFERAVPGYEPSPGAEAIAMGTFEGLVRQVTRAIDAGDLAVGLTGDPADVAQRLWAMSHGWVSLEIHGLLKAAADDAAYEHALVAACVPGRAGLTPSAPAAPVPGRRATPGRG